MTDYTLLTSIKEALNSTSDAKDTVILEYIEEESAYLERYTRRRFDHRIETRYLDPRPRARGGDVLDGVLYLGADVISVSSLLNGTISMTPDQYELLPAGGLAYDQMGLTATSPGYWWNGTTPNPRKALAVAGIWGYGGRWKNSGNKLSSTLNSSDTSASVSGIAGFEQRQILRLGNEYMLLESTPESNTLELERAVNGSTGAEHAADTPIYIFMPDPQVRGLIRRAVIYRMEQNKSPLFGLIQIGDMQAAVNTSVFPKDIIDTARLLRRPMPLLAVD